MSTGETSIHDATLIFFQCRFHARERDAFRTIPQPTNNKTLLSLHVLFEGNKNEASVVWVMLN